MARTFFSVRPPAVLRHVQKISVLRRLDLGTQASALVQAGEQYRDAETKTTQSLALTTFASSIKNERKNVVLKLNNSAAAIVQFVEFRNSHQKIACFRFNF